jgi:hypothetical protein
MGKDDAPVIRPNTQECSMLLDHAHLPRSVLIILWSDGRSRRPDCELSPDLRPPV